MNDSLSQLRCSLLVLMLVAASNSIAADKSSKIETKQQPFTLKLGATRIIYSPDSSGATLTTMNEQDYPILVKSSVLDEDKTTAAPFIVTPPLFRLDGHQQSKIRIIRTAGDFAKNRETLKWLCVKGIPPQADDQWAKDGKVNAPSHTTINVQVSVTSCIKMLVRPSSINGEPTDVASEVVWQREGNKLKVTNPTPFYMNLKSVSVGGKKIEGVDYIPPQGQRLFTLPQAVSGDVVWQLITDLGGDSRLYKSALDKK